MGRRRRRRRRRRGRRRKKEENEEDEQQRTQLKNKMETNTYPSIITSNVNGLNAPTKRHRVAQQIRKKDPHICCLQKTQLRS